jgi:hypothetical protein
MEHIERKLAEAAARGEFDAGPAKGRRILLDDDGPGWWTRREIDRIRLEGRAADVMAEVERELGRVWLLSSEARVRQTVAELNRRLEEVGMVDAILDADETVATWRKMARMRLPSKQ